ncbi:hypothetical protein SDRG_14416 [Saprolegnia diclina VS20]|uniref:Uncharacterized protein n=1 Tax=Saprolegnia diclina (strain VS20) TaxID=1156394 RepID=T0RDY0_SAPDV|nr:hypothetical protein SDRG_14416 [Saprolegnia diclina VS20]EQC27832.1 hypothetical protein SDRG_14416 [Saprolegnia diclina VS20]|eukprot:XP_008618762.1 hypothetical protein SDRG_14416 [Saprolegnia diclina VS20]
MPVCRRTPPAKRAENDYLIKNSSNVTSQGGEDGALERVFSRLDEHEGRSSGAGRWCVEFGAWDASTFPTRGSFCTKRAGTARSSKPTFLEMQTMYAPFPGVACVNQFGTFDGHDSLEAILARHEVPLDVNLVSIAIDGADYHIWESLRTYAPKVAVIEFNPTILNNVAFIQDKDMSIYQSSSLAALIELGKTKFLQLGYELVSTTTFNGVFVKREFYDLFGIADNAIDKMHDVSMGTEFSQLYDGTLKITGVKKLLWKKQPILEKDIHVLPPSERKFPLSPPTAPLEAAIAAADALFTAASTPATHFLDLAQQWSYHVTYPHPDLQRLAGYALARAPDDCATVAAVFEIYLDHARALFTKNEPSSAIPWLEEALYLRVSLAALKAPMMALLGEAFIRSHDYAKAELWLQTAHALDPAAKTTLKSLVPQLFQTTIRMIIF